MASEMIDLTNEHVALFEEAATEFIKQGLDDQAVYERVVPKFSKRISLSQIAFFDGHVRQSIQFAKGLLAKQPEPIPEPASAPEPAAQQTTIASAQTAPESVGASVAVAEHEPDTLETDDPDAEDVADLLQFTITHPTSGNAAYEQYLKETYENISDSDIRELIAKATAEQARITDELIALWESGKAEETPSALAQHGITGDAASAFVYETCNELTFRQCQRETALTKQAADNRDEADRYIVKWFESDSRKGFPVAPETAARYADIIREQIEKAKAAESAPEAEDPPLDFPRLTGSLAELCDAICPDIPYDFKIAAAITYFGLMRSGIDTLESAPHLQPRFYTCFVKEIGWGKSAALNEIRRAMQMVTGNFQITSSVDSGPSLVDEFADITAAFPPMQENKSARLLLDPDEMTGLFEKAKISAQSRNTLFGEMLKLFEGNITGNRSRKSGKSKLENAHLSIVGGATPEGFAAMWTGTGGGGTGLQSRFILVTTNKARMPINPALSDSARLVAAITRLRKQAERPGQAFRMTDEASEMLDAWWKSSARDSGSAARADAIAKRLLIVLAATNDTTVIGPDLVAQAIRFGDYLIAMRERFNPADSYSWVQAFEGLILSVYRRAKEPVTLNKVRRQVRPERKPGGFGAFKQACQNLVTTGALVAAGSTHKGTAFRLG